MAAAGVPAGRGVAPWQPTGSGSGRVRGAPGAGAGDPRAPSAVSARPEEKPPLLLPGGGAGAAAAAAEGLLPPAAQETPWR